MPFTLPVENGASAASQSDFTARVPALLALLCAACAAPKPVPRDANGRVLSSRRYENSFYPVFRPEVAGG